MWLASQEEGEGEEGYIEDEAPDEGEEGCELPPDHSAIKEALDRF